MEWYEKFERLREVLGDETVFTAIKNYFTAEERISFAMDGTWKGFETIHNYICFE